ncbi:DivIVA domain-containing protein [Calidifontibacter sp. DB0510]|uniref:DivIVA domain-containing protein n=1 Tax=Metallococcus carri TaxID=1656884 RepID=A0A967B4L6_9MICO|nr:DivIVA domain-containing protein [Metallococcus carri]NHN57260.1 DivIVA domain-containing protein [Metallococcus carri]NOP37937.1 DivIVA domain-containing protein [Calidifontibacter sp. DB2511S]
MTAVPWTPTHVALLQRSDLPTGRGGYVFEDVDRWIEHAQALMAAGRVVPPLSTGALRRTKMREGYQPEAVEALAAHIAEWQRNLQLASATPAAPVAAEEPARRLRWTPQQIDWVRESTFGVRRGGRAYVEAEVDTFLDDVLVAMTKGEPLPSIDAVRFFLARRGARGYDAHDVDTFLDDLKRLRPAQ